VAGGVGGKVCGRGPVGIGDGGRSLVLDEGGVVGLSKLFGRGHGSKHLCSEPGGTFGGGGGRCPGFDVLEGAGLGRAAFHIGFSETPTVGAGKGGGGPETRVGTLPLEGWGDGEGGGTGRSMVGQPGISFPRPRPAGRHRVKSENCVKGHHERGGPPPGGQGAHDFGGQEGTPWALSPSLGAGPRTADIQGEDQGWGPCLSVEFCSLVQFGVVVTGGALAGGAGLGRAQARGG